MYVYGSMRVTNLPRNALDTVTRGLDGRILAKLRASSRHFRNVINTPYKVLRIREPTPGQVHAMTDLLRVARRIISKISQFLRKRSRALLSPTIIQTMINRAAWGTTVAGDAEYLPDPNFVNGYDFWDIALHARTEVISLAFSIMIPSSRVHVYNVRIGAAYTHNGRSYPTYVYAGDETSVNTTATADPLVQGLDQINSWKVEHTRLNTHTVTELILQLILLVHRASPASGGTWAFRNLPRTSTLRRYLALHPKFASLRNQYKKETN